MIFVKANRLVGGRSAAGCGGAWSTVLFPSPRRYSKEPLGMQRIVHVRLGWETRVTGLRERLIVGDYGDSLIAEFRQQETIQGVS